MQNDCCKLYANVYVLDIPYSADKEYAYFIPPDLRSSVDAGAFVVLPFGNSNRKHIAYVSSVSQSCEYDSVKPIFSVLDFSSYITDETAPLCMFMKERFFCSFGAAMKAILPPGMNTKPSKKYIAAEFDGTLSFSQEEVYRYALSKKSVSSKELLKRFPASGKDIAFLVEYGALTVYSEIRKSKNEKNTAYVRFAIPHDDVQALLYAPQMLTQKQRVIVNALWETQCMTVSELLEKTGMTAAVLSALTAKGIIEKFYKREMRIYSSPNQRKTSDYILSGEQSEAFDKIKALMDTEKPQASLLYGVTGSGKTKVIISAVREALLRGKTAIILLPEIGLTAQALSIYESEFGSELTVIHSMLSQGERIDTYKRISDGKIKVVIGTRSAIFAPLKNIGIIAIDEEQEHTYKSEQTPKYHARDVARFRCAYHNALMLLASATPSVESFYKAKTGVYTLVTLSGRYNGSELPEVIVEDMRTDSRSACGKLTGERLIADIKSNIENGEQTILFVNRRGYNSYISCRKCGYVYACPNCSVSLTYHAYTSDNLSKLICHYCGYTILKPLVCCECGSEHIGYFGYGTQLLQDELSTDCSGIKTIRMDTDTTAGKHSHDEMLASFGRGEADVLFGTQMVAKGLDFPNVSLVGVISVDSTLYMNDFRASERTFSLLTQLVGRAGRAKKAGKAIIQTYNPEHQVIKLGASQNYEKFFDGEIKLRRAVVFPPFCSIAVFVVSAATELDVKSATEVLSGYIAKAAGAVPELPFIKYGPYKEGIYKLQNLFRQKIIIKYRDSKASREVLKKIYISAAKLTVNTIKIELDVNPSIV